MKCFHIRKAIPFLALFFLAVSVHAQARSDSLEKIALDGAPGFVLLTPLTLLDGKAIPAEREALLSSNEALALVKLKLRTNHIPYWEFDPNSKEHSYPPNACALQVGFTSLMAGDFTYAYSFTIRAHDFVKMNRPTNTKIGTAIIWTESYLSVVGAAVAKQSMKEALDKSLTDLCLAWLNANPKS